MHFKFIYVLLLLLVYNQAVNSVLIPAGIASVGAAIAGLFSVRCMWKECCTDKWIPTNFTDLSLNFNKKVHGQHLVINPLIKFLKGHAKKDPSKALAISFHGSTGTGKTYVSKLVVESMYKKGMQSKYVKLISATKDFKHKDMLAFYKDQLKDIIETSVKECKKSFFIFDEMHKMPSGLIDTLKPYLDYHEDLGGVDYRQATFFFLSNTAGNDIADKTISQWTDNKVREDLTLKEMEEVIRIPAFNLDSGLWHSELITENLLTAYIPFLPLERKHVKQCIKDGLISKGYYKHENEISDAKVQEIADELRYFPDGIQIFSDSGCKRVDERINLIMEDLN